MALRRQLYSLAEKEFKIALELNPEEGEHHAMAAWAAWCNAENKEAIASSVKKELNRAIELNPKCAPAFYYLGQLYKHMGDEIRAMASFQKVLNQVPGHVDALREVRLIDMRRKHRKK
jgi:tetratricopeptide (TPR) repeat protein